MNSVRLLGSALLAAAIVTTTTARAAMFATEVVSYVAGDTGTFGSMYTQNPSVALGGPSPIIGTSLGFESIFTPFNGPFEADHIVQIGVGGSITLRLSNFVIIDRTPGVFELGVWENVAFSDRNYPNGLTEPTTTDFGFGSDYARVEVSQDGVTWYSLNNGDRILFDLAGTYFSNATNHETAPANPQIADFGKPFTYIDSPYLPTRDSLTDKTMAQVLSAFNGSGGGNWLNLDGVPLDEIGFVRFSDPLLGPDGSFRPNDNTFEIDFVAINTQLAGAPTPEPSTAALLLVGLAFGGTLRQRRA